MASQATTSSFMLRRFQAHSKQNSCDENKEDNVLLCVDTWSRVTKRTILTSGDGEERRGEVRGAEEERLTK